MSNSTQEDADKKTIMDWLSSQGNSTDRSRVVEHYGLTAWAMRKWGEQALILETKHELAEAIRKEAACQAH